MNHLAHLFLAQSNTELLIGNYIADHVKGKQLEKYPEGIQKGIKMHRAIDTFTDQHKIVAKSKKRLYPKYSKYSPVLVDMFYDHILAKNWSEYSPIPIEKFSEAAYRVLGAQRDLFPPSAQRMYDHMSTNDWLSNYAYAEGMQRAFNGLAYRASFESKMEEALIDLQLDYADYKKEFEEFFPHLVELSRAWIL